MATPPPDTIFRGPHGIRAGWRVLLFLALVVLVTLVFMTPFVVMRALRGARATSQLRSRWSHSSWT